MDPELLKRMMMGEFSASGSDGSSKLNRKKKPMASKDFDVIDLHFDKIEPDKGFLSPSEKMDLQMKHARDFIEDRKKAARRKLVIITGKGEGKLQARLIKELSKEYKVSLLSDLPWSGAAVQITM
ncbi:hypothetical protein GYB22_13065 [bacterium]|nr:hypothetical protein [bacterium]